MGGAGVREEQRAQAERELGRFVSHLRDVRRLSAHTVRAYERDVCAYLEWCDREGRAALAGTHTQMRAYVSSLVRARYAEKTINRRLSALRTYFAWLEREGVTEASAVAEMPGRKLARTLPTAIADADVRALIATCDDTDTGLRDRALIELLYASGARISEVAGLTPAAVDFDRRQVRLFGKGSKERFVPLYDTALTAIRHYVDGPRARLVAKHAGAGGCTHLFVSTRGNDMSADTLRRCFEGHVRKAGLSGAVTPHVMRHTFATELLDGGADLKAVQELLGHEGLDTTQIYTHLSIDRLKQVAVQAHPRA